MNEKNESILLSYAVGVDRLTRSAICFVDSTEIMSWPALIYPTKYLWAILDEQYMINLYFFQCKNAIFLFCQIAISFLLLSEAVKHNLE